MHVVWRGARARGGLAQQARSGISRELPTSGLNTAFKKGNTPSGARPSTNNSAPYDWTRTYRKGQTMTHPTFGFGETPAVI
jgi:hypothetical protein